MRRYPTSSKTTGKPIIYLKPLRLLNAQPQEKILDVGCGGGALGVYMKHPKLYGLDINKEFINYLKMENKQYYKQALVGDIKNIPFEDNFFDKSICLNCIYLLNNWQKAIMEIIRVTKGNIVITFLNMPLAKFRRRLRGLSTTIKITRNNFIRFIKINYSQYKIKETFVSSKLNKLRGRYFCAIHIFLLTKNEKRSKKTTGR